MKAFDHSWFFSQTIKGKTVKLDPVETHHATSVMRLKSGDEIIITDGCGNVYTCKFNEIKHKELYAEILSCKKVPRVQPDIKFFIGIPDHDAMEELITNLTPLGITTIIPVIGEHCRKNWWDQSWAKQLHRFHLKAIGAMKQSLYPWEPAILEPVSFKDSLNLATMPLIVADPEGCSVAQFLENHQKSASMSVFIGPPGGFSPEEIELLRKSSAQLVKIATNRLRTELATTVLASQIVAQYIE